ncbi:MAG: hypothetical protein ACREST_09030 [Steroidobacteraceae bacterium]
MHAIARAVTRYGSQMRNQTLHLGQPSTWKPMSATERMRRMRARRKAAGLKVVVTWKRRAACPQPPPLELRLLQARSLALHVMAARKIDGQPQLLEIARSNLARWRERNNGTPGAAIRAWRRVLRLPWPEIAASMTEQSENGVRLRSTTPFLDVLTRRERKLVYDAFRVVKINPGVEPR